MTRLGIAVLALLILSPAAHADDMAGLEFLAGFGSTQRNDVEGGDAPEYDLKTTFGVSPWWETPLGKSASVGGELNFLWFKGESDEYRRRLVVNPHARLRMSFPIVPDVTFDGFLSVGPSWWTSNDESGAGIAGKSNRFGWGVRFGFGGSYMINQSVQAYTHIGYLSTTSYGSQLTIEAESIPFALGLRASY